MSKIRFASEEYVNAKASDWDASADQSGYIKNRTHWVEKQHTKYDWNTYIEDREADLEAEAGWYTAWGLWCCRVDENPIDFNNIIGSKMNVRHATNNPSYSFSGIVEITEENIVDIRDTNNMVIIKSDHDGKPYECAFIVYDNTTYRTVELTKGIWIVYSQIAKDSTTRSATNVRRDAHGSNEFYALSNVFYHTLDKNYLPMDDIFEEITARFSVAEEASF